MSTSTKNHSTSVCVTTSLSPWPGVLRCKAPTSLLQPTDPAWQLESFGKRGGDSNSDQAIWVYTPRLVVCRTTLKNHCGVVTVRDSWGDDVSSLRGERTCQRAAGFFTPGPGGSSTYFHVNQSRALVWPVGIAPPGSEPALFGTYLSSDCTDVSCFTGSGHSQGYRETSPLALISAAPERGRTGSEQNVSFNNRITLWKNIAFISFC